MTKTQFYPTPDTLITKMLNKVEMPLTDKKILDPSAGQGHILDAIKVTKAHGYLYAIEIDPQNQAALIGKNHRLIDSDFLTHIANQDFDLIVMNPPFNEGDKHLLKAIEIMKKGEIVCLLNAETIKNLCDSYRQLLAKQIEDWGGSIEYIQNAFLTPETERKTGVEVALIHLTIDKKSHEFDLDFDRFDFSHEDFAIDEEKGLVRPDVKQNFVDRHNHALSHLKEAIKHLNVVQKFVTEDLEKLNNRHDRLEYKKYEYFNVYEMLKEAQESFYKPSPSDMYFEVSQRLTSMSWQAIINLLNVTDNLSRSTAWEINNKIEKQAKLALTVHNIDTLIAMLLQNKQNFFTRSVVECFNALTKYHEHNRIHVEGWKTNSSYMINRKVILPYGCRIGWDERLHLDYNGNIDFNDLDKVCAQLEGIDIQRVNTIGQACARKFEFLGRIGSGKIIDNECESTFFEIKFWKKGTFHLYFKSKELWDAFNYEAMKGNNWLPPGTKVDDGKFVVVSELQKEYTQVKQLEYESIDRLF